MKRSAPGHATPEEILTAPEGPLLKLDLICNKCGASAEHSFEYVLVNPENNKRKDDGWDGVLLPRIIKCKRCKTVDDYTLGSRSYLKLTAELIKVASSGKSGQEIRAGSRIIFGISKLWDGTLARRPSQAIEHLSQLTHRHPKSGEAWRRLGNAQERFGQLPQAEISWRKALNVDPGEVEAAYSLAKVLGNRKLWPEAFGFLREGIKRLPSTKELALDQRLSLSRALIDLLEQTLDVTDEPIALMAGWSGGVSNKTAVITMSSVDLRKVKNWDRLSEFLVSEDVVAVDLTTEIPKDEPTILERRLAGSWIEPPAATESSLRHRPVVNPQCRVGRNDPCPCGSGRKYKRCCGK